jgi:hypothetical protein
MRMSARVSTKQEEGTVSNTLAICAGILELTPGGRALPLGGAVLQAPRSHR